MPLIEEDTGPVTDLGKFNFRDRLLREGRVVPILSDEAIFDQVLGGYGAFVDSYARYVKGPECAQGSLVSLIKYYKHRPRDKPMTDQALKFDYLNYVKNYVYRQARSAGLDRDTLDAAAAEMDGLPASEFAGRLGYPSFTTGPDDPLLILANLPFKTILTTSPYTFVEDALRKADKKPRTEVCRWTKELQDSIPSIIDDIYQPSAVEPLVYHLLGLDRYVDSLVFTEDDYLEYLGNICQGQGYQTADHVSALVRKTFSYDLVVLGFSLDS
jgi:SIR2-like domain